MLSLWRRHTKSCKYRSRKHTKCDCPVWCDGEINGKRVIQTLNTRDWARAARKLSTIEDEIESGRVRKKVADAISAFMEKRTKATDTDRKYLRCLAHLGDLAATRDIQYLDEINLEILDEFQRLRKVCDLTWSRELQRLRTFFRFCLKRKWCNENPAQEMEMPPDPKPQERPPYTSEEITRIIAACETFGRGPYERLRARAMVLLMRFYGFRISDVATLERNSIKDGQIRLHALKNGADLWQPLFRVVEEALERLPMPRAAAMDCPYFFWNGSKSRGNHIKTIGESLSAVFRKSGVEGACAHRFRHTLTTEILVTGGTIEDAANILGDSPTTIKQYYAKWSVAYQNRTVEILRRVHGTFAAHTENLPVNTMFSEFKMVPEVGLEPTRTVKCAGF